MDTILKNYPILQFQYNDKQSFHRTHDDKRNSQFYQLKPVTIQFLEKLFKYIYSVLKFLNG